MLFVTLGESLGTARTFASGRRNRIDANQELLALGAANLGAGLFQGFAVGGNPSTTSSSNAARSKTQLASLVTAAILILTIILRVDLIGRTPQAVVSVVVIISISHLMQSGILRRFYHTRKTDFILAMIALLGVLVLGIFPGLVISVLLSLLAVLYHSSQPRISVLGKLPHHEGYADVKENPEIILYPGTLILRPNVPLFFANANLVQANIINLVHGTPQPTTSVILDLSASNDLDIAVTDMLSRLIKDLSQDGTQVMIADAGSSTIIHLKNAQVMDLLPTGKVYRNIQEAIDAALNPVQAQE
jgi:MFS superfamily sulfate permease-like transporter